MESSWRAEGPTVVLLLCHQGKSLLGYLKMSGFCFSSSSSIPCAGKEAPKAPHLAMLHGWHTLSSLDGLLGKLDLTWKHTQWWVPGGCEAGTRSVQRSVLPMEQRGAAAVPVERQTSLGCLCQAGDPSAPTGEGLSTWAESAQAGTSHGASCSYTHPSRCGRHLPLRKWVQERLVLD